MFIIAVVIAFSLALMGDGLRRTVKANELLTATALAQYRIDYLRNINFPPTTDDRTDELKGALSSGIMIDSEGHPDKITCPNTDYKIEQTIVNGPGSPATWDKEVVVKVYKKPSSSPLVTLTTYISRNGAI